MKKYKIIQILYYIFITAIMWVVITNAVQAFKCDKMTQTELFKHIPKSIMLDWKKC